MSGCEFLGLDGMICRERGGSVLAFVGPRPNVFLSFLSDIGKR